MRDGAVVLLAEEDHIGTGEGLHECLVLGGLAVGGEEAVGDWIGLGRKRTAEEQEWQEYASHAAKVRRNAKCRNRG
jgi:hypothetical protein